MAAPDTKTVTLTIHALGIGGITISRANVTGGPGSANAVIGKLAATTIPSGQAVTWALGTDPASKKFVVAADGTVSVGAADVAVGDYRITVTATGVAPPPPPPPPLVIPKSIAVTPAAASVRDTSIAGTKVADLAVTTSDGSPFAGQIAVTPPGLVMANPARNALVLSRSLATSDDGPHAMTVTASQGGTSVSASFAMTVIRIAPPPPPPPQPILTVTPMTPRIPDTTPRGTVIATYSVTMSDGSPFAGSVRFGAPNFDDGGVFSLSAPVRQPDGSLTGSIVINPAGPGVGPNAVTQTDHITLETVP